MFPRPERSETNDLIYEGIATPVSPLLLYCLKGNKRPDLRRDCDDQLTVDFLRVIRSHETNDLIYEGIATPTPECIYRDHV